MKNRHMKKFNKVLLASLALFAFPISANFLTSNNASAKSRVSYTKLMKESNHDRRILNSRKGRIWLHNTNTRRLSKNEKRAFNRAYHNQNRVYREFQGLRHGKGAVVVHHHGKRHKVVTHRHHVDKHHVTHKHYVVKHTKSHAKHVEHHSIHLLHHYLFKNAIVGIQHKHSVKFDRVHRHAERVEVLSKHRINHVMFTKIRLHKNSHEVIGWVLSSQINHRHALRISTHRRNVLRHKVIKPHYRHEHVHIYPHHHTHYYNYNYKKPVPKTTSHVINVKKFTTAKQLLAKINNKRASNGLSPLKENSNLDSLASDRAQEVANSGNLTDFDGSTYGPTEDADQVGLPDGFVSAETLYKKGDSGTSYCSENVWGNDTSNHNKDNELSGNSLIGIGIAHSGSNTYIAEEFTDNSLNEDLL